MAHPNGPQLSNMCSISLIQMCLAFYGASFVSQMFMLSESAQILNLVDAGKPVNSASDLLNFLDGSNGLNDAQINQLQSQMLEGTQLNSHNSIHEAVGRGEPVIGIMDMGTNSIGISYGHDVVITGSSENPDGSYTYTYYDPATNGQGTATSDQFWGDGFAVSGINSDFIDELEGAYRDEYDNSGSSSSNWFDGLWLVG